MTSFTERTCRAVFLDRDGVINVERKDYVKCWEEFVWLEGAKEALAELARTDFKIIIITNQAGIGKGLIPLCVLDDIHARMKREIESGGGRIDAIYVCPHRSDEGCLCRKPRPGLVIKARDEMGINLKDSFFIGDTPTEVEMARGLGLHTIHVRPIDHAKVSLMESVASDLREAVRLIVEKSST